MKHLKLHPTGRHSHLPKHLVQRSATCVILFILLVLALCALTAISISLLVTNVAHAQPPLPRRYLLLIDQSGSVMSYVGSRELARQTVHAATVKLRMLDVEQTASVQIDAFGTRRHTILPETTLSNPVVESTIDQAFVTSISLGGTLFDRVLTDVLSETNQIDDVLLITDGWPDLAGGGNSPNASDNNEIDRTAYATRLHKLATQFSARGIRVHIILTGNTNRANWLPMWQAISEITGGLLLEIRSSADLSMLDTQFAPVLPATVTPSPTPTATATIAPTSTATVAPIATSTAAPTASTMPVNTVTPGPTATTMPSPTLSNTATPKPTHTATTAPTITPTPMSTSSATPTSVPLQPIILIVTATPSIAATDAPLAPFVARLESAALTVVRVGLCGIVFLFVSIVLTASRVAGRRRRYRQTPVSRPVADKGHLDICSAELETTGEMKRVELEPYVMGEILTVGQGAQFGIDLCGVGSAPLDSDAHAELPSTHDVTLAALIFTPRGPVIEGRAAPLCVEGQVVAQHLFFDGDVVYLDRYAIFYTNFFRRAPPDELGIN